MKKFFALIFVLSFLFTSNKVFAFSGSGSGTLTSPYQISSCTQLQEMNNSLSSNYVLTNNIDCSETSTWNSGAGFNPIGNTSTPFTGSLNGNGYKVTGLYINRPSVNNLGFFGQTGSGSTRAKINNIGLENISITGTGYTVGGLVGFMYNSEISNVYTTGTVISSGSESFGGIVGAINQSYSNIIFNSYSRANITGKSRVGGVVGYPYGTLINVYSTGIITATGTSPSYIGGLSGISGGTFIAAYWDVQTSGATTSGAGIGKTTNQMKSTSTYENWDFEKVWSIDPNGIINDGYPYLNVFNDWTDTYHLESLTGSGTSIDPYIVTTCNELQNIKNNLSAYYKLGNNIDCSSYSHDGDWYGFLPIGNSSTPFTGNFNGDGYKITGLYINRPNTDYIGLFGYVGPSSVSTTTIKNVGLEDINIIGKSNTGGIVGFFNSGNVSVVYTTGTIKQTNIVNTESIGGLIGGISNSYSATLFNSYSRANVSGKSRVGGAIGNPYSISINIYSTGLISLTTSAGYVGGLVSLNQGIIINSYWDTQSSGTTTSPKGTGKTTSEMKATSTFFGWDFEKVWSIDPNGIINDGYPYLNVFNDWTDTYHLESLTGSGTSIDPYIVTTCNELQNIKNNLSAYYKLGNNIDCSSYSHDGDWYGFLPIGNSSTPFTGNFNGDGYKITGLYINRPNTDYIGLFGYVGPFSTGTTTLSNFGLENINLTGKSSTGGVAGFFNSGNISLVYTTGEIRQINDINTSGVGGIIGSITNSYNATVFNSYSRARVSGKDRVGGVIGSPYGTITNVYSTGLINTNVIGGGLIGIGQGVVKNSYWDIQTSGTTTSAAGVGKTTEQMKATSTFLGWDFGKTWSIDPNGIINDGYPYLNVFKDWTDTYHLETLSGSGTSIDPYIVTTCNQLQNIKNNLSAYYKLGNNIDCSTYSHDGDWYGFYPIGNSSTPFTGNFNGNGYKITGLYINRPNTDYVGLFGYVDSPTTVNIIKNLGLENVNVSGKTYVGGLIGTFHRGEITTSYTKGKVSGVSDCVGGIIGAITSSYTKSILNSFSNANVSGANYTGGTFGYPYGTITNVYSTGLIKTNGIAGGLVGANAGNFTSSYWDTQTSGTTTSPKGTGKTTAEMQTQSTFSGWDFTNIWVMNGYPILRIMSNTLTYIAGSNGSITGSTIQSITTGANGTEVTAVPNTGYHFTSWNDGVLTASRTDTNVLSSQSYTASFAINTYTVNYSALENGSITGNTSQVINYGGFASEVTAVPNTGYHFTSWSDGVLTASRTDINITSNISVTANFEIDTHTLTYVAGSHGTISGSSTQIINYGSNGLQVEAIPDEDYRFVEWSDGSTSSIRTDYDIREDKSFTAEFVINQRTLSYTAGDNGTISGDTTQTVTIGQDGTSVTAIPNTGYHFVSWSDGVLTASRTDTNITNSISVIASFAINTYTLNYIALEGGTISGSSTQIVDYGSDGMNVIATPDRGYRFISWSDDTTNTTRYESNVTQNLELSAIFKKNSKTYTSCTEYEYTEWSSCEDGIQTRELINAYPLGCIKNDSIIRQSCEIEEEKDDEEIKDTEPVIKTETPIDTPIEKSIENPSKEIIIFTKNLQLGDIDEEVKLLQKFLNSQGFILTQTGAGSPNNETNKFGLLTKQALIKYQEAHKEEILTPAGLSKGTGYFGKMTRDYINKLFD